MRTLGSCIESIKNALEKDKLGKALKNAAMAHEMMRGGTSDLAYKVGDLVNVLVWEIDGENHPHDVKEVFQEVENAYLGN